MFTTNEENNDGINNKPKKKKSGHYHNHYNLFIRFSNDYHKNNGEKKVKMETISQTWMEFDAQTKQERYDLKKPTDSFLIESIERRTERKQQH